MYLPDHVCDKRYVQYVLFVGTHTLHTMRALEYLIGKQDHLVPE